eukprot:scaffold16371_cov95-Isochrysis_galbana.AAC.1
MAKRIRAAQPARTPASRRAGRRDTRPLSTAADMAPLLAEGRALAAALSPIGSLSSWCGSASREMSPAPEQLLRSAGCESKRADLGCGAAAGLRHAANLHG